MTPSRFRAETSKFVLEWLGKTFCRVSLVSLQKDYTEKCGFTYQGPHPTNRHQAFLLRVLHQAVSAMQASGMVKITGDLDEPLVTGIELVV